MHLLDKRPLATGLWLTLTLKGSAAQLYFLTHLFVLTLAYAAWERCFNRRAVWAHAVLLACAVGLTLALPMPGSAGSDFRLMPLYVAAFVFGALFHLHRNAAKRLPVKGQTDWRVMGWLHAALLLTVALLGSTLDTRLITLFGVISLIAGAMVFFPLLPDRRLPGSGGVYLFHTPILNYAVSTALVSLSIVQRPNLVLSVLITYGLSLLFTLALIRYWPALRGHVLE